MFEFITYEDLLVAMLKGGGGRKGFLAQTLYFISKYNLDIIALIETRVNSNRAQKIIAELNLQNVLEIHPDGFYGGFWLLWKIKHVPLFMILDTITERPPSLTMLKRTKSRELPRRLFLVKALSVPRKMAVSKSM